MRVEPGKLGERFAGEGASRKQGQADHANLSLSEIHHLDGSRDLHELVDHLHDLVVRVDDQVDIEVLFVEEGKDAGIGGVPDPGDFFRHLVLHAGDEAGDHVHFVAVGHRDDHRGVGDSRLAQDTDGAAAPVDGLDVQGVLDPADFLQVAVDDDHILIFLGEPASQVVTDFAGPDDDDAH